MKITLQPFLDRLTSHSRLSATEQEAILGLPTHVRRENTNSDFVGLDQTTDHVSVVVQGVVARFGQNAEGDRQILGLHIAGDAPDLHLVVMPSDTSALKALSNTTILRIPHTAMRAIVARHPAVAEAFWRDCVVDAAITARWAVNLGRRDAKTRVAHLLCEMAVRNKGNAADGELTIPFPLTQAHLADATGLTAVHVNRTLRALTAEGFVILAERQARILDWDRLVRRGEFNANYLQVGLKPGERLRIMD